MSDEALREQSVPHQVVEPRIPDASMGDELYRQEVLEARRMAPEDKLILGERLFRWACAVTLEGIRSQHPALGEADCLKLLQTRIELGKKLGTL